MTELHGFLGEKLSLTQGSEGMGAPGSQHLYRHGFSHNVFSLEQLKFLRGKQHICDLICKNPHCSEN